MKPPQHPEDLYLSSLLLRHRLIDESQLRLLNDSAAQQPDVTVGDLMVEAGFLDYHQRKALARLFESEALRDVLEGRADPGKLSLNLSGGSTGGPMFAMDPDLDMPGGGGAPRDLAATYQYKTDEAERLAKEDIGSPPRDLAATYQYQTGEAERLAREAAASKAAPPRDLAATYQYGDGEAERLAREVAASEVGPLDMATTRKSAEGEALRDAREHAASESQPRDLAATYQYGEGEAERLAREGVDSPGDSSAPMDALDAWEKNRRAAGPRLPAQNKTSSTMGLPAIGSGGIGKGSELSPLERAAALVDQGAPEPSPLDDYDDLDRTVQDAASDEFDATITESGGRTFEGEDASFAKTIPSVETPALSDSFAKTIPSGEGFGPAASFAKTIPSSDKTPLMEGSFADTAPSGAGSQARWGFMENALGQAADASIAGAGGNDNVDLLAASSQGFDMSSLLTEDEITRLRENSEKERGSLVGRKIGGYVIIDKLGEGGQGEVYMAKQLSLNRYVAFKVLPETYAFDPQFVDRFMHEARMLARMTHSNVVRIFDVGRAGDMLYITMESISGQSLKELIVAEEQVALDMAINILKQCCRALGRVKKEGIAHRDIKPGNILLDSAGEVKVVDFGLADFSKDLEAQEGGHTAGTPFYMPPEAFKNKPATHLSDQYSLGATFFHMIAGQAPFRGGNIQEMARMHMAEPVPNASDFNPIIPASIDKLIAKMMAKDPEDRYGSFREVFDALEEIELKMGLIATGEDFLGEGLVRLRESNLSNIKANIVWWCFAAVMFAAAAMGLNAFARETMEAGDAAYWMGQAGSWGTYIVALAYFAILYVAMIRRRWVRPLGSVRLWIQIHIALALVGSFLVLAHSGSYLRDFVGLFRQDAWLKPVALLPLLNTLALVVVVASGMIGRYIYRDLRKQAALERISADTLDEEDRMPESKLAVILISQRAMGFWRIVHYPLTIMFIVLTIAHVISILYFGGGLHPTPPGAGWFPAGGLEP